MFTGLIEAVGQLTDTRTEGDGLELTITCPWDDLKEGESIAVSGACLTVVTQGQGWFTVHVVSTSLGRTRFGTMNRGVSLNLERALRLSDRLGGHLVSGHVDGIGLVAEVNDQEEVRLIELKLPPEVAEITVSLGSITVDGVSLTVNDLKDTGIIQLSIIPFTLQHTTLHGLRPGDQVHLEGDMMGKYVRQLLLPWNRRT